MNLLFFTFTYLPRIGGAERSVHNLARELASRGHRVTIATDAEWSGIPKRGIRRASPADVLALEIPDAFAVEPWKRFRGRWIDRWNLIHLANLCRRRRINVLHCHLINVDTRYAAALKKSLGLPLMITLRGSELTTWLHGHPKRKEFVRQMLCAADTLTALSEAQLDDARKMEPAITARVSVIPNPVDIDAIRNAVDRSASLPGRPYLLFCGRFVSFKSIETLIEAYHRVIASNPAFPADLILAGSGDLDKTMRTLAARGPAASRIRFLGDRPWEQSLRLIQEAAFLVLPSFESEGCPNVLLEAMALGTPAIVADNPRLLEMVRAGVNGEVFARRDPAALKACLERVSFDPERRADYAREGVRHLEARHRFGPIVDTYEALYTEMQTRGKPA